MSTSISKPPLYPPNLYHLSPTYNKWCPLRCTELRLLRNEGVFVDGKPIHHHPYSHHPIRFVKLIGLIVAIDDFARWRVYTIDDGSGVCIKCHALLPPAPNVSAYSNLNPNAHSVTKPSVNPKPERKNENSKDADTGPSVDKPAVPWEEVEECKVVRILCTLSEWQDVLQVNVVKITIVGSTEGERKWWDECLSFKKDVLGKVWVLSEEEIRQSERKERKERERRERKDKEKERAERKRRRREKAGKEEDEREERKKTRSIREQELQQKRKARSRSRSPINTTKEANHTSRILSATTRQSRTTNPPYKPPRSTSTFHTSGDATSKTPSTATTDIKRRRILIPPVLPDKRKYDTFGL